MAFDLGNVMARKQEHECARLDDFEFRRKARAIRLLADRICAAGASDVDPAAEASRLALESFERVADRLRHRSAAGFSDPQWRREVARALDEARRSLILQVGDPAPHRLA